MAARERDYVLGTGDAELARLGLQHRVWRARTLDAWERAGFTAGQMLLDLGCGPGYATRDLAEIAGPSGRVFALDRSRRFLDALEAEGMQNVQTVEIDLDQDELQLHDLDGAWARWVFAFVRKPRELVKKVREALRPGAPLVIHEYFDYATWRLAPRSAALEEFVTAVMTTWRADGGEPDIALDLPRWLADYGFELRGMRPIIDVITTSSFRWLWPKSFIESGVQRLLDLRALTAEQAARVRKAVADAESSANAFMISPAVMEIIAVAS